MHEIGVPFENRHLSFARNQHKDPAYLAIDRWPLTEVAGILLYLARPFPQAGILPVGDIEAEAALVQTLSSTAAEEPEWRLRCDMAAVFRIAARVGRTPKGRVLHPRYLTTWPTTSTLVMGGHGVTVIGPRVHDAFDALFIAERTAMYQMTAVSSGQKLRTLPDARLHLDAWRRVLDRAEPDYATLAPSSAWKPGRQSIFCNDACDKNDKRDSGFPRLFQPFRNILIIACIIVKKSPRSHIGRG